MLEVTYYDHIIQTLRQATADVIYLNRLKSESDNCFCHLILNYYYLLLMDFYILMILKRGG